MFYFIMSYTIAFISKYDRLYLLFKHIDSGVSHKQHRYICSNRQQYIVWVNLCQKSLDIKIMFHEDISYRKYIKT